VDRDPVGSSYRAEKIDPFFGFEPTASDVPIARLRRVPMIEITLHTLRSR